MMSQQLLLACILAGCSTANVAQEPPHVSSPAVQVSRQPTQVPRGPTQASRVDAAMVGDYELDGVMETGSGLRLGGDGNFEWGFSYGALDLYARGKWQRSGNTIELMVEQMRYPPQGVEMQFQRMRLRIDGEALVPAWPWDMDGFRKGEELGRYVRSQP